MCAKDTIGLQRVNETKHTKGVEFRYLQMIVDGTSVIGCEGPSHTFWDVGSAYPVSLFSGPGGPRLAYLYVTK